VCVCVCVCVRGCLCPQEQQRRLCHVTCRISHVTHPLSLTHTRTYTHTNTHTHAHTHSLTHARTHAETDRHTHTQIHTHTHTHTHTHVNVTHIGLKVRALEFATTMSQTRVYNLANSKPEFASTISQTLNPSSRVQCCKH